MNKLEHCLWLLPASPLGERLQTIIRGLAPVYGGVTFEPHVTLYSVPSNDEEMMSAAALLASRSGPVKLTATAVECSDQYTRAVYVSLSESEHLKKIVGLIKRVISKPSAYILSPHLSLLYSSLPVGRLKFVREEMEIPLGPYLFDAVQAIETETPIRSSEQIKGWRTICRFSLRERSGPDL